MTYMLCIYHRCRSIRSSAGFKPGSNQDRNSSFTTRQLTYIPFTKHKHYQCYSEESCNHCHTKQIIVQLQEARGFQLPLYNVIRRQLVVTDPPDILVMFE